MFDCDFVKQEYGQLIAQQDRMAEAYRRWLLSYEQAKLDPYAQLMSRKMAILSQGCPKRSPKN